MVRNGNPFFKTVIYACLNPLIYNFLEPFSYLIYTITLCLHYQIRPSVKIKVLIFYYTLATLLMSYASWSIIYMKNTAESNNNWVYNIFYFLSNFFLSFYMYKTFTHIKSKIITLSLLLINVTNFFLNDLVFKQRLFDSFVTSIFLLSLIILIFLYFQQVLGNVTEQHILLHFDFWLLSGYLIFFLGSFFIIMSWSHLSSRVGNVATAEQKEQFSILWGVHNILLFISALITFIGSVWIRHYQRRLR